MDDKFKYNPLEVDEGGWIPVRNDYSIPPQKESCKICQYSPVILFLLIDWLGAVFGIIHDPKWIWVQLLVALIYIKNINSLSSFVEKDLKGKIIWKPAGVLLVLVFSILLRKLIFLY